MHLDHIFLFVDDVAAAEKLARRMGLVETYRREHKGQGTSNICYCFENAFLELLILNDARDAKSDLIKRTGLYERANWRRLWTCPIGVSWRSSGDGSREEIETWSFQPPYLPEGGDIKVAVEGDDPFQPMMFRSPGKSKPVEWPPERRGNLQNDAGFRKIRTVNLISPQQFSPGRSLLTLADQLPLVLTRGSKSEWELTVLVETLSGEEHTLVLL